MTRAKTSVRVTILGDDYTLRSATSAEETQTIAKQVDHSIREIMASGLVVETHKAAILACLRMAGELAQARSEVEALAAQMTALSQEIRPWLPPAKRYD
ncbi:MAG: cell division protein ZapA [Gemmatimonadaceae bacterium]